MLKGLIKATVLSDTHRHIYKEKVKDSFYNEFVSQSIIKIAGSLLVWQGGGIAYFKELINRLFLYVR